MPRKYIQSRSQVEDCIKLFLQEHVLWRSCKDLFVSVRTVQKILRQFYDLGSVEEAGTLSGHYRELSEAGKNILRDIMFNNPRVYLDEIKSTFEELTGKSVHNSSLCREVRRLGLTRQSIHRIVFQHFEIERAAFKVRIELMDPSIFVWLKQDANGEII